MVQSARPSLRSSTRDISEYFHSQAVANDGLSSAVALRSSTRANKTLYTRKLHPNATVPKETKPKSSHSPLPDRTSRKLRQTELLETKKPIRLQSKKRRSDGSDKTSSKIINGVQPSIGEEQDDDKPQVPQLPQTNGTNVEDKATSEETRSLRSKAGGSRLKSDLATYFSNFEDIITGVPQTPGTHKTAYTSYTH
jgi:hypothetical protein